MIGNGLGVPSTEKTEVGQVVKTSLWSFARMLLDRVPAVGQIMSHVPAGTRDPDRVSRDKQAEAGLKGAEALVGWILPDELEEYKSGNYPIKTARLFKATSKVMDSQTFPMPFVVFLCDNYGVQINRRGEEARSEMSQWFTNDARFKHATWDSYTAPEQWRAVTDAMKTFVDDAAGKLVDPANAGKVSESLPETLMPPAETTNELIEDSFAPEGLALYQNFLKSGDLVRARQMEACARAFKAGWYLLFCSSYGELKPDAGALRSRREN